MYFNSRASDRAGDRFVYATLVTLGSALFFLLLAVRCAAVSLPLPLPLSVPLPLRARWGGFGGKNRLFLRFSPTTNIFELVGADDFQRFSYLDSRIHASVSFSPWFRRNVCTTVSLTTPICCIDLHVTQCSLGQSARLAAAALSADGGRRVHVGVEASAVCVDERGDEGRPRRCDCVRGMIWHGLDCLTHLSNGLVGPPKHVSIVLSTPSFLPFN
jgi:hypothetical protein